MNKKNAPPVLREGYFYGRSWKKSIQHERMDDAALSAFFRYCLFYTAWGCHFCVVTAISHSDLGHAFTLHP